MSFEEAVQFLKKTVKYSAVKNQKHLDPTLISADQVDTYNLAMYTVNDAVEQGKLSRDELLQTLGLI